MTSTVNSKYRKSIFPFEDCINSYRVFVSILMTAWDIFLKIYFLKSLFYDVG